MSSDASRKGRQHPLLGRRTRPNDMEGRMSGANEHSYHGTFEYRRASNGSPAVTPSAARTSLVDTPKPFLNVVEEFHKRIVAGASAGPGSNSPAMQGLKNAVETRMRTSDVNVSITRQSVLMSMTSNVNELGADDAQIISRKTSLMANRKASINAMLGPSSSNNSIVVSGSGAGNNRTSRSSRFSLGAPNQGQSSYRRNLPHCSSQNSRLSMSTTPNLTPRNTPRNTSGIQDDDLLGPPSGPLPARTPLIKEASDSRDQAQIAALRDLHNTIDLDSGTKNKPQSDPNIVYGVHATRTESGGIDNGSHPLGRQRRDPRAHLKAANGHIVEHTVSDSGLYANSNKQPTVDLTDEAAADVRKRAIERSRSSSGLIAAFFRCFRAKSATIHSG